MSPCTSQIVADKLNDEQYATAYRIFNLAQGLRNLAATSGQRLLIRQSNGAYYFGRGIHVFSRVFITSNGPGIRPHQRLPIVRSLPSFWLLGHTLYPEMGEVAVSALLTRLEKLQTA